MYRIHGFLRLRDHLTVDPMTLPEMQWHHREAHMTGDRVDGPIGPGAPDGHVHDELPLGHPMPQPGDYLPYPAAPSRGGRRVPGGRTGPAGQFKPHGQTSQGNGTT